VLALVGGALLPPDGAGAPHPATTNSSAIATATRRTGVLVI